MSYFFIRDWSWTFPGFPRTGKFWPKKTSDLTIPKFFNTKLYHTGAAVQSASWQAVGRKNWQHRAEKNCLLAKEKKTNGAFSAFCHFEMNNFQKKVSPVFSRIFPVPSVKSEPVVQFPIHQPAVRPGTVSEKVFRLCSGCELRVNFSVCCHQKTTVVGSLPPSLVQQRRKLACRFWRFVR